MLSLVSKQVFERRLIEKFLAEHGTDPVTGEPLSDDMIVDIKSECLDDYFVSFVTSNYLIIFVTYQKFNYDCVMCRLV